MRMRLIESALHVFAEKGIDATDIKDVIEAAQVSRGSFYNYFQTNDELMGAVLQELGNELLALVDAVVTKRQDPAERVACGLRMVLRTASQHPLLARFVSRAGIHMVAGNSLAMQYLPRDIQTGLAQGHFHAQQPLAALTMTLGTAHAALCAMAMSDGLSADFPEEVAFQVLLGLGVRRAKARAVVSQAIEAVSLPADALLARTHSPTVTA